MTSASEQAAWIAFVGKIEVEKQQRAAEIRSYEHGSARTGRTVAGRRLDTTADTIASLRREIDSLAVAAADARCRIVVPLRAIA